MAGAFSGHLLDSFNHSQSGQQNIVTSGAMTFNSQMHGFHPQFNPMSLFSNAPISYVSEESATKIATLQAKLNKKLGPEFISQRPGPGGGTKLTYAEGWKIINLANEVFGFNGWSSNIINLTTDFIDYNEESRRYNVGVTAIVRVTLRDGVFHEDVGYGMLENSKSKAAALDKCKKEAITDALKRTLRNFGNLLGNCLYDKAYAQEVVKIKVPPAKFDKDELYRRPEFEEAKPKVPVTSASLSSPAPQGVPETKKGTSNEIKIKSEAPPEEAAKPISYVPRHLRQEVTPTAQQTPKQKDQANSFGQRNNIATSTHTPQNGGVQNSTGLNTPIQTPALKQINQARGQYRPAEQSPLARQQPTERRVSFADPSPNGEDASLVDLPAVGDGDDSFSLNSEDDAFLAAVDLGEGDLGRPIDFEEGMGGVTADIDESLLVPEQESRSAAVKSSVVQPSEARTRTSTASSDSGIETRRSASLANSRNQGQLGVVAPVSVAGQQSRPSHGGQASCSAGATTASASTSLPTGAPAHESRRPGVTSMGGFNFPPGMKPPMQQQAPRPVMPPSLQRIPTHQPGPSNGLKRSADAMQGSSSSRPLQGMGLAQQQQQQQNAGARRTPLGSSDVGENGDFKRVKR